MPLKPAKTKPKKVVFEDYNPNGYARGRIMVGRTMIGAYGYDRKQSMFIATIPDGTKTWCGGKRIYRRTTEGLKLAVSEFVGQEKQ